MSAAVVGLTGGIGSGKSAVAGCFAALGVTVVDTDAISHALTGAGGQAIPALHAAFGQSFITADGALDRAAMRTLVFSDVASRQRLQAILHPAIRVEAQRQLAVVQAAYAVLVVPLLIESPHFRECCQRIAVVDCSEETQVGRVMQRSGLSAAEVRAIIASQVSRTERLAAADDVIDNEGSLDALCTRVGALHSDYLHRFGVL